jgi:hypothetical protein
VGGCQPMYLILRGNMGAGVAEEIDHGRPRFVSLSITLWWCLSTKLGSCPSHRFLEKSSVHALGQICH